jgi:hypothetical protein
MRPSVNWWSRTTIRSASRRSTVLITIAALAFVVPSLVDLLSGWKTRPFSWVAPDAFYYLTVGRNVARFGRFAFDQERIMNGFHPLWQVVVAGLALLTDLLRWQHGLVLISVIVGVACIGAGIVMFGLGLAWPQRRLSILFPLLPVGAYGLFAWRSWLGIYPTAAQPELTIPLLYGTLWSFANGMESCLVLLFMAYAGLLYVREDVTGSTRSALKLGLALSGLVLARLDHAFLVLPLLVFHGLRALDRPAQRPACASLAGAFAVPLASYMAINHAYTGMFTPLSGVIKSNFPLFNNLNLEATIRLTKAGWKGGRIVEMWREGPMVVPPVFALAYLLGAVGLSFNIGSVSVRLRSWTSPYDRFLTLLAPGVILLATYNFLYVWDMGQWYFPASVVFASLVTLRGAAHLEQWLALQLRSVIGVGVRRVLLHRWLTRTVAVSLVLASLALVLRAFWRYHRRVGYQREWSYFYWEQAEKIRAHYGANLPKFLEYDDGIIAFSLGARTMSHSLALDPEGHRGSAAVGLFTVALERGHDRITSLDYPRSVKLRPDSSQAEIAGWIPQLGSGHIRAAVDYLSEDGRTAVFRFWKP